MKIVYALFAFIIAAYLYLIVSQTIFPFIDLPNHLAEATIYKFSSDINIQRVYQIESGINPNSFHYLFCSIFPSVELGNKIYYLLYCILLPFMTFIIIRHLGGNWKFSFLSLLLIFNYNVSFGFAGFTMVIPFVLLTFYLLCIDKYWSRLVVALLLMLLFSIHILGLLFSLFLIGVLSFFQSKNIRSFLSRIWVVLPAFIMMVLWYGRTFTPEQSTLSFMIDYYRTSFVQEFYLRSKLMVFDNFVLFAGYTGVIVALVFSLLIIVPVLLQLAKKKSLWQNTLLFVKENKESASLCMVSFICFFFLPDKLPGQGILYQRFSVFFLVSFIIAGSILYRHHLSTSFQLIGFIFVISHFVLWADYLSEFDRKNTSFTPDLFSQLPRNEPMGGVIIDFNYRGRPVYIHFPSYNIVWNKGITTTKIIDYRFGAIRRKVTLSSLPEYQEWIGIENKIPEEYSNINYLLIKGEVNDMPADAIQIAGDMNWKMMRMYEAND